MSDLDLERLQELLNAWYDGCIALTGRHEIVSVGLTTVASMVRDEEIRRVNQTVTHHPV